MGAALGSIIARLIAAHITVTTAMPVMLHDVVCSGPHNTRRTGFAQANEVIAAAGNEQRNVKPAETRKRHHTKRSQSFRARENLAESRRGG